MDGRLRRTGRPGASRPAAAARPRPGAGGRPRRRPPDQPARDQPAPAAALRGRAGGRRRPRSGAPLPRCERRASRPCRRCWTGSPTRAPDRRAALDGLDLEVRRTGRERDAARTPPTRRRPDDHHAHHPAATGGTTTATGRTYVVFERTFRAPDRGRLGRGHRVGPARPLDRHLGGRPGERAGRVPDAAEGDGRAGRGRPRSTSASRRAGSRSLTRSPDDRSDVWHLELDLAEADGVTTLTFAQDVPDPEMAESVGPGLGLLPRPAGRRRDRRRPGDAGLRRLLPGAGRALPRRARRTRAT